jgi:hypothetical protein
MRPGIYFQHSTLPSNGAWFNLDKSSPYPQHFSFIYLLIYLFKDPFNIISQYIFELPCFSDARYMLGAFQSSCIHCPDNILCRVQSVKVPMLQFPKTSLSFPKKTDPQHKWHRIGKLFTVRGWHGQTAAE